MQYHLRDLPAAAGEKRPRTPTAMNPASAQPLNPGDTAAGIQYDPAGRLRHLLTLAGMPRAMLVDILDRADRYMAPYGQPAARSTELAGKTVSNLFFEPSTRTRASFELAAKRLSADVLNLDVNMSSRIKGESILDTIYTLEAMETNIFVVRDAAAGVPEDIARHVRPGVSVLNAGEANVAHPTQGLLDVMTMRRHKPALDQCKVCIIGDIAHSRVARSAAEALSTHGVGELCLVAPPTLQPEQSMFPGATLLDELEPGLRDADIVMALRIQRERIEDETDIPDAAEYARRFGLSEQTLRAARPDAIVMHPGPMNRGVEIDGAVADGPRSVITEQVRCGVAVRMAVLAMVTETAAAA
jgi:aspartate carbamoyltransferase catalytic subunit